MYQSGLTFLHDLRRDLRVKDHVIQQCVSALHDLLSDRKHAAPPALQVFLFYFTLLYQPFCLRQHSSYGARLVTRFT